MNRESIAERYPQRYSSFSFPLAPAMVASLAVFARRKKLVVEKKGTR